MKVTSLQRLAILSLPLLCISGCATTTAFKPHGVTDEQLAQNTKRLMQACEKIRQNSQINIQFYDGIEDSKGNYQGSKTGYFYGCNKLNESLAMSDYTLSVFDRGEPYPLKYIAEISVVPEAARVIVKRPVKKSIDWQRQLLTE
jgi:hypothetical protein